MATTSSSINDDYDEWQANYKDVEHFDNTLRDRLTTEFNEKMKRGKTMDAQESFINTQQAMLDLIR